MDRLQKVPCAYGPGTLAAGSAEIPTGMAYQRMDDSMVRYGASIDADRQTLKLTKDDDKNWIAIFSFQRPAPDRLLLDGEWTITRSRCSSSSSTATVHVVVDARLGLVLRQLREIVRTEGLRFGR